METLKQKENAQSEFSKELLETKDKAAADLKGTTDKFMK